MGRSYSATSLVTLPRLTAVSAGRLLQELLSAAAAEKKLPTVIAALRDALTPAYDRIEAELAKRVTGEEPPVVRAADLVEDNAFAALYHWLSAWTRLPAERHEEATEARVVLADVFSGGLEFLKIRPADEWQEAEVRLGMIADKGYDRLIAKIGGQPFLDELQVAHKGYGEALNITARRAAETPEIREALNEALDEVRAYVLGVVTQVKKADPVSAALADRLLAPLTDWKDTPVKSHDAQGKPGAGAAKGTGGATTVTATPPAVEGGAKLEPVAPMAKVEPAGPDVVLTTPK